LEQIFEIASRTVNCSDVKPEVSMIRRGAEIEKHLDLLRIYGMLLQIYDFEAARRTKLEMDVQLIFGFWCYEIKTKE
jgi:hypothetical protein